MMIAGRGALAKRGEDLAADYFRKKKYKVITRNYRCPLGEIDLVVSKDKTIVFVEVKTRSSRLFGEPEEAITWHKKRKLRQVAEYYLKQKRITDSDVQFDILSIVVGGESSEINHFNNALEF